MNYKVIKYIFVIIVFTAFSLSSKAQNKKLFSFTVLNEISDLTYQFSSDDYANNLKVIEYNWSFGDGESSKMGNPLHQYLDYGYYEVILAIVLDDSSRITYTETIGVFANKNVVCDAFFSYFNLQNQIFTYKFLDNSSHDPNDTIFLWEWDFGDNTNPVYSQSPIHQFPGPGTYQVTLSIRTTSNCISTKTTNIVVSNAPLPCNAVFTEKMDTSNNLRYFFHDDSSSDDPIISHKWYFDDGDSSSLQDPVHVYPYPGVYNIKLIIETNNCISEFEKTLVVGNPQKYNMWGRVYAGNYTIDKCIAYLYKDFNGYIKPIDTVNLTSVNDTLGVYYFYQKYEGIYKVKVLLPDSSIFQQDFAPTYYGNSFYWPNANTINLSNNVSAANVIMIPTNYQIGNSYISGYIDNSSNTDLSNSNVEVLLLNNLNEVVAYTFSDANGNYQFKEIPSGYYRVMGEITGLHSNTLNVYLSKNDSLKNLNLYIDKQNITAIKTSEFDVFKAEFKIFPNPATDFINIFQDKSNLIISQIKIFNNLGQLVFHENIEGLGVENKQISISNLPQGLYIIRVNSNNNRIQTSFKFVKN